MTAREHWDRIYSAKTDRDVSWFEPQAAISLRMIHEADVTPATCVVDIGGGNSRLIDALLDEGLCCLAMLDVSPVAIEAARARLGGRARRVTWIEAEVTQDWSLPPMEIWHDRAVFHFLTTADGRAAYRQRLRATLSPGGSAIIATFALDGPEKCSGLPVARYSPETLAAELGADFALVAGEHHVHVTPWGSTQSFQYSRLRRTSGTVSFPAAVKQTL